MGLSGRGVCLCLSVSVCECVFGHESQCALYILMFSLCACVFKRLNPAVSEKEQTTLGV